MITPSFGLTATERVLPRLALDWTTGLPQAGVDVVRAGVATFVGSDGLIQSASANTQRIDYSSGTPSLLVEEARTNLLTYSDQFNNAAWTKLQCSVSANAVISPDGTQNADSIIEDGTLNAHQIAIASFSFTSGTSYTISTIAKPNGRNLRIGFGSAAFTTAQLVVFNLTTGTGTVNTGTPTFTITPYKDGYYRCSVTATATATAASSIQFVLLNGTSATYQGNGTSGVYLWGAQQEVGAFPTSVILTAGSAVTRNADVSTMTWTNFSDWYKAGAGSIHVKASQRSISGIRPIVQLDDTTADNFIVLRGNAANPELYIKATTDQAQLDAGTIAANTAYRLAGSWATNSVAVSVNSGAAVLDGSATIPTVTQMRIGNDGTNYLNGLIESIEYYDQQLFPSNLQLLSASKGNRSVINTVMTSVAGSVINRVIT